MSLDNGLRASIVLVLSHVASGLGNWKGRSVQSVMSTCRAKVVEREWKCASFLQDHQASGNLVTIEGIRSRVAQQRSEALQLSGSSSSKPLGATAS